MRRFGGPNKRLRSKRRADKLWVKAGVGVRPQADRPSQPEPWSDRRERNAYSPVIRSKKLQRSARHGWRALNYYIPLIHHFPALAISCLAFSSWHSFFLCNHFFDPFAISPSGIFMGLISFACVIFLTFPIISFRVGYFSSFLS
jgi:hypothetical protein